MSLNVGSLRAIIVLSAFVICPNPRVIDNVVGRLKDDTSVLGHCLLFRNFGERKLDQVTSDATHCGVLRLMLTLI